MTGPAAIGTQGRPPRIVVLGSVNQDVTVVTPRLPMPGQTVMGTDLQRSLGGKGSNQAVAAARAGAQVELIGSVGSDDAATALLGELAAHSVEVARVRRVDEPTGTALITVDGRAENTIVVVPGANGTALTLDEGDIAAIAAADLLLIQLELPMAVVRAGLAQASAARVPVLLNPSPAQVLPAEVAEGVAILVANEGEAAAIGLDALAAIPHVITTLGARGATYVGGGTSFSVPAPVVDAVDTTGAGDAFTGAFAAAWARGDSPLLAVRQGCVAGALAATRPGASASAPTRSEIEDLAARIYG